MGNSARLLAWAYVVGLAACAGAEQGDPDVVSVDAATARDSGAPDDDKPDDDKGVTESPMMTVTVEPDSESCDVDLPFHPPGCSCAIGETADCWTGPPGKRGKSGCHDGVQECEGIEFGTWTPCHDEGFECVDEEEPPPPGDGGQEEPPPPGEACECVPGAVITCSEDCAELIICSITGTKVCQPDGTWSPCREWDFDTLSSTSLCRNMFFGCLPFNSPGVFLGDCADAFTCGEIPPPLQFPPPDKASPPEKDDPPEDDDPDDPPAVEVQ